MPDVIFITWNLSAAIFNETPMEMLKKERKKKQQTHCIFQESLLCKSYTNYYFILIDKTVNMLLTNLDCRSVIASQEPLN